MMNKFIEFTGYSNLPICKEIMEVDFSAAQNEVECMVITFDSKENTGTITVRIEFNENIEFYSAKRIAEKKAGQIVRGIIFTSGIQIYGIELTSQNFTKFKSGSSDLLMSITVPIKLNATHLNEIQSFIQSDRFDHVYYDLYSQALNHDDDLGKFMFLYSLLMLVIKAENQPEVDGFILTAKPEEEEYKQQSTKLIKQKDGSFKRSDRFETRFTWLRNQVGHTQEDSDITNVINEMKSCHEASKEIVKHAIQENI